MLASASGPHGLSVSQICIWDLEHMVLKRTLTHHQFDIVCLAYARDDRFLISVGMFSMLVNETWNLGH